MPNKKKSMVYPAIFMIVLSAILTFILAFINEQTKPIVERNAILNVQEKILNVLSVENDGTPDGKLKAFADNITETGETFNDEPIYKYEVNGEVKGYAVAVKGNGLWGPITGFLGLSSDYKEVLGLDFTSQQETPGLGGRIEEDSYKNQYRNIPSDDIASNVDGISGATGTSSAVQRMIDANVKAFLEQVGGN